MEISLIAAMADNRVIGNEGEMPWHLPSELQYFKELTMGKPIIMGRNTFVSIGRPLPGRHNIVITSKPELLPEGVTTASNPQQAIAAAEAYAAANGHKLHEIMVIGGGQVYEAFLPEATRLYLTHIDLNVPGDTFFPAFYPDEWERTLLREHKADNQNPLTYRGYLYKRILRN
ncbi:type 3 dihydrofolate reductase [Aliidiomarina iranensis]|uniref:Dihydrofolate reductase n=1 Tax=Aliidiomarina iranensis TaxID=1434071 RepID=A0A432W2Y7_9GAMM|nr:type 3 dihydrofolate reductase [Aliidiomarina iranensis]RUO23585.1 type 3 dihydrofolate reductase [Aliidiomarina iranensis]